MSDDSSKTPKPREPQEEEAPSTPHFSSVPWGPGAGITVALLTFVGAQIVGGLLLYLVASLFNIHNLQQWLDTIPVQFVFVLVTESLILCGLWLFLRKRKGNFRQLGFSRNPVWKDVGYALAAYLIYFAILATSLALIIALTPIDSDQRQNLGFRDAVGGVDIAMAFISLVVLPPIVEEIIFRGFLFQGMRKKLTFAWAAIITSVLFAALHLFGGENGIIWTAAIDTLILSFVLCYLREKTGALWSSILVHALKNSLAFVIYIGLISV